MYCSSSSAPDYYGFLDRMRRPAAADLIRSIKSFIVSFSLDATNAEEDSNRVQEFLLTMESTIKDHPLWLNASYEEIDNAIEAVKVNFFRGFRFSLAWWAYTFPMTGASIATIKYTMAVTNIFTRSLSLCLCAISTLTISILLVYTIIHAFVLRICFRMISPLPLQRKNRSSAKCWLISDHPVQIAKILILLFPKAWKSKLQSLKRTFCDIIVLEKINLTIKDL